MSDYAELVATVVDITGRPNLIPQIQRSIAKATLKAHLIDFWLRDIVEKKVSAEVSSVAPRFELYISTQLPRFRKLAYLNGYDDTVIPPCVLQQFSEVDPTGIRDLYYNKKENVCYYAGDIITIYTNQTPPKFLIGYFTYPKVQSTDYESWIAEMFPDVITDEASVEIFGSIGDFDEANRRKNMFKENIGIVRTNGIELFAR